MNNFKEILSKELNSENMPVIFIGHGNPMNAITDNEYRKSWVELGEALIKPKAILCISAHWTSEGTFISTTLKPKTIHDFYGFPKELSNQKYNAPGSPEFAAIVANGIKSKTVYEDSQYGLDHGAWSVLKNMFPDADVPVFQMSLDVYDSEQRHFALGKEISFLRSKGVLVIGSGNVVHNLRMAEYVNNADPYEFAVDFDEFVKTNIETNNSEQLIQYKKLMHIATRAHPTNEHYLPLLYILGLRRNEDRVLFFNSKIDMASIGMRSVVFY